MDATQMSKTPEATKCQLISKGLSFQNGFLGPRFPPKNKRENST